MKSPKHAGKAAKPRLAYFAPDFTYWSLAKIEDGSVPCLVLPMPTLSAAKKRLKWEKLSEEQKCEAVAWTLCGAESGATAEQAKSVINKLPERWLKLARSIPNLISP